MLIFMSPAKKWRALLTMLALGLWAGGAAAQSDDDGWFDSPEASERPQLKIQGKGQYDPPPPDFRSDPRAPDPSYSEKEPASITDEAEATDEDREDGESQRRALSEFSPHLAPYGYWVDDPFYGRVWVPHRTVVGAGFRPYVSGGHWALTADDDWLWVSDYPFGWVTFHYGRWAWLSGGLGWGWVPGYVYSPAWVDFRIGSGGYVGWGPAPPYSVWRGGAYVSLGVYRPIPYIFCPTTYVFSPGLHRHVVYDRHRVRSIASQTYRYRPRYVSGSQVRVRGPSPREARIPNRYVPTRRVVAQPRATYVASEYRGRRDAGIVRDEGRRYSVRPSSTPSESRYRSSGGRTIQEQPRARDPGPRGRHYHGATRGDSRATRNPTITHSSRERATRPSSPATTGSYRQFEVAPSRTPSTPREARARSDWGGRRTEVAPRARDGGRERATGRSPAAERRSSGATPPARGGRGGGSSGGHQQRSRRDDR
jgi:hypothetical protein